MISGTVFFVSIFSSGTGYGSPRAKRFSALNSWNCAETAGISQPGCRQPPKIRQTNFEKGTMAEMGTLFFLMLRLAVFTALPASALAGGCPEIRLDSSDGSMGHVPMTAQGHVGICYANVAAQMIDAFRFSHDAPEGDTDYAHISSPLDLAVGFTNEDAAKSDFGYGAYHICPVASFGIKTGTCDQERVRQLYWKGEQKNFTVSLWKTHKALQEYLKAHAQIHDWEELKNGFRASACEEIGYLNSLVSPAGKSLLPGPDLLMNALRAENYTPAMLEILKPVCDTPPRHPVAASLHCEMLPLGKPGKLSPVHELLEKKNAQPIAVKTCSNIMTQGKNYRGVNDDGTFAPDCKKHFLLIIGQKEIDGKCRFLMRNSWGSDEDGYSEDWQPPEHGNLWIDEDSMAANTKEMCSIGGK
ncbi:MAG: hypothetical protein HY074_01970 [Deltaproteobacteria bacterium]|nr:hypothetical protein [Deltaproteobacteria bacterium]